MRLRPYTLAFVLLSGCGSHPILNDIDGGLRDSGAASDGGADAGVDGGEDAGGCVIGTPTDAFTAVTTSGLVRGQQAGNSLAFLGIPYATPPLGPLRFTPPQPPACWNGVRDATQYGSACPQPTVGGNEDCLYLNVWTPALAGTGAPRPVLFFIHGGANVIGASNNPIPGAGNPNAYDGQSISDSQNAVVVTTNYRLGALGWLAHPALDAENAHHASGNYGLLDQIAALTWVQNNIASFGGDPSRVMVYGESAGAWDTCALVASPLAKGLFSAALMESGVCSEPSLQYRESTGAAVVSAVGCQSAADVAACLRSTPASTFVTNENNSLIAMDGGSLDLAHVRDLSFGAAVDGWVLPNSPLEMIQAGTHNHVPFAVGSNANEWELFVPQGSVNTCLDYTNYINAAFDSTTAAAVLNQYPCGANYSYSGRWALVDVFTDLMFTCSARQTARALAASGNPAFRYFFTHTRELDSYAGYRAYHTAELPFVFGTLGVNGDVASSAELALSSAIEGYWTRFAATGNPNGADAGLWPAYDAGSDDAITFDDTIGTSSPVKSSNCDFWDGLIPP